MSAVATMPRVVRSTAVVLSPLVPIRVQVRVERQYGWRAWARTNPGPLSVVAAVGLEAVIGCAGIVYGFYVPPWWAPVLMAGGAWRDWRQRWDERRYVKAWTRT